LYGWLYQQLKYTGSNFKARLVFPRLDVNEDSVVDLTEDKLIEARNWLVRTINRIESKNPDEMNDWEMCNNRSK
ncbi:hypothetical protein, partial [Serratia marcescens]|uniref:hypothetical protein n=1 Tax=Serratia marcescens TaxID=615 RepID=UPI0019680C16